MQQAAEKAIKGMLIHFGIRFPYVHDLAALLALIEVRLKRPAGELFARLSPPQE
jgi:HEPN domain-containing protein